METRLLDEIVILNRLRKTLDEPTIIRLMESIQNIGLQTPLTVRWLDEWINPETGEDEGPAAALVAGAHRLEAVRRLGWTEVPVTSLEDARDARLWEISENLHRSELTELERAEHIAEWVRLIEEKLSGQVGHLDEPHDRGSPNKGISAAARGLTIPRTNVRRAIKIDAIPEDAKEAAREAGIDDNQSALLTVAKSENPVEEVAKIVESKKRERLSVDEIVEREVNSLMKEWDKASPGGRQDFMTKVGLTYV